MNNEIEHGADTLAIGRLVTGFQYLEAELLRLTVAVCMPGDQRAVSILASQLSFRKLVEVFVALVAVKSDNSTIKEHTKELAGRLCQLEGRRNTYIHSHYDIMSWNLRGQQIIQRKHTLGINNGYVAREEWFDPAKVECVLADMTSACRELFEIENTLIADGAIPA